MSSYVQCGPRAGGTLHDHRYIHPMNIAFLDGRLEREFVAFIPDKDEVTSSILVSPTDNETSGRNVTQCFQGVLSSTLGSHANRSC